MKNLSANFVDAIYATYPTRQAIYLYGTWGTAYQRRDSDLDIAVLLPHNEAQQVDSHKWRSLAVDIAALAHVEYADLINLRCADTTFQAEILRTGRLIHCADEEARLEFESLILSMHQKLNQERAGIKKEIIKNKRVYAP